MAFHCVKESELKGSFWQHSRLISWVLEAVSPWLLPPPGP